MPAFTEAFLNYLDNATLWAALAAVALAGFVRGFAGFGGAMMFMPFGTILFEPRIVVVAFFLIDTTITLPLVRNGFKLWDWRTVMPCVVGGWVGVWFGAYLLATSEPLLLRWTICAIIIVLVMFMLTGWRYTQRPRLPISLGVGGVSGVLGGVSQVSAPPVVAYWVSGPSTAPVVRANLIMFFFFATFGSLAAFFANSLFSAEAIALAVILAPAYGLAIFAGAKLFHGANDGLFRKVALAIILIAAVTSMPLLDPILRP